MTAFELQKLEPELEVRSMWTCDIYINYQWVHTVGSGRPADCKSVHYSFPCQKRVKFPLISLVWHMFCHLSRKHWHSGEIRVLAALTSRQLILPYDLQHLCSQGKWKRIYFNQQGPCKTSKAAQPVIIGIYTAFISHRKPFWGPCRPRMCKNIFFLYSYEG